MGRIIGEVADDDAGKGAAIGATAGVLKGGAEARRKKEEQAKQQAAQEQQQQDEAAQQQEAAAQEKLTLFKKGFGACLESKGYTVK